MLCEILLLQFASNHFKIHVYLNTFIFAYICLQEFVNYKDGLELVEYSQSCKVWAHLNY